MASLTCDADQESLVVNLSWEVHVPSDANCTSCTVISMTTGQTRNQLVCNRTTVAFELNCSETYNISLTAVNDCGLQSDQTSVEITLGMYMYNTHTIHNYSCWYIVCMLVCLMLSLVPRPHGRRESSLVSTA